MTPDQPLDPPRRQLDLSGGRLAYTDEGQGPPVVAIHGLPGSVRDWRWLAPALLPDLRLLRVDLPGLGQSDAALCAPRVPAVAAVLAEALDRLGIDRVVLLGHSFGTAVAVAMATALPDRVAGLALLGPIGSRVHQGFRSFPAKGLLARLVELPGAHGILGPGLQRAFVAAGFPRSTTIDDAVQTLRLVGRFSFPEHRKRLSALTQPVLLGWCADDRLVEAPVVDHLAQLVPAGPRLRFDTGGHNLQKTRAVELGRAMRPFVHDLLGAVGSGGSAGG